MVNENKMTNENSAANNLNDIYLNEIGQTLAKYWLINQQTHNQ